MTDATGTSAAERTAYCASCREVQPVTLIRGQNGARDHERCDQCRRTWPVGKAPR